MTTDWQNRGGETKATPTLPPMDLNVEHTFELVSVDFQDGVVETYDGVKKTVNKVKMVWKEEGKEKDFHRIWTNFNEFYAQKSNLMKFLVAASGKPFVPGVKIRLGDYLDDRHKIRARLLAKIGKDGMPNGYYKFIDASIKPATVSQATTGAGSTATLADAMVIAKGAKSGGDAFALLVGKVPNDIIQQFVAADKAGQIKYPIA